MKTLILSWFSHNRFKIQKTFWDEIHLIPDALRGAPMKDAIKWVRTFEVQMITLTATLSRPVEALMLRTFLSSRQDIAFFRASVDRPEQSIQVLSISAGDLLEHTSRLARAVNLSLQPDERCIVFLDDIPSLEAVSASCHKLATTPSFR